ncbi:MAG: DJ-1/PfpI family protein [Candidatus Krumholzibacteriia bacterium]
MSHPPQVLVPVADGTEEIEAVTVIDTLRRAGCEVAVASVGPRREVTCSRGVVLVADARLVDLPVRPLQAIVLPGGMPGAEHLRDCAPLIARLGAHDAADGLVAAICAAPVVVLQHHGLLRGRRGTCHPAFYDTLPADSRRPDRVVMDGNLLTSRGPGTALEFALALVGVLCGPQVRHQVATAMLPPPG